MSKTLKELKKVHKRISNGWAKGAAEIKINSPVPFVSKKSYCLTGAVHNNWNETIDALYLSALELDFVKPVGNEYYISFPLLTREKRSILINFNDDVTTTKDQVLQIVELAIERQQ